MSPAARIRILITRAAAVGTVVVGVGGFRSAGGQTVEAPAYTYYNARAIGNGVTVGFNITNLLPVQQLLELSSVTTDAHLAVGTSTALAALPYPGDLVLSLPGTAAGLAGLSGLPNYPAAVNAEYPITPSDSVNLVPDAGLGATRLEASAGQDQNASSASIGNFDRPIGLIPFTIGSVRTTSSTARSDPATFAVKATSDLTNVDVLGGVLHIGSISSTATVTVSNGTVTAERPVTTVSGVTAAGMPVGVTDHGLVAMNRSAALAPIVAAATAPLRAAGITVRTTPTQQTATATGATAVSSHLELDLTTVVDNLPTVFSLSLGDASSSIQLTAPAAPPPSTSASEGVPPAGTTSTGTPPMGAITSPGAGASSPGGSAATPPLPATTPSALSPATIAPVALGPANRVASTYDFRSLYRWMALATVALIAARWAVLAIIGRRRAARPDVRALWRW